MHVLVSAASKHGATAEIAEVIGETLAGAGIAVTVADPARVEAIDGYDAFVLGSAVYAGRWQKSARDLAERIGRAIAGRPVWLFSSGPLGVPPPPMEDPADITPIRSSTSAREHRLFPGRLELSTLDFAERAMVASLRGEYGDFRDWDEIRTWAEEIAERLRTEHFPAEPTHSTRGTGR